MVLYRGRVEKDLERWVAAGHVSPEGARAIRRDLAARASGIAMPSVLAILAAVLLSFGAMLFVAAHWQDMSRLARLGILSGGLWAAYGLSGWFFARQMTGFGHAALLLGIGLFGASIMLVAQMYHLDGHPPDAVLLWAGGAFLAAVLLRSNAAYAATIAIGAVWSGMETAMLNGVHWWLPPAVVLENSSSASSSSSKGPR